MRVRLLIVIVSVLYGWSAGHWTGVLSCLMILGVFGFFFPYRPKPQQVQEFHDHEWEKIDRAKRGSAIDPTRPDDHPLLLTNEIRRRR